MSACKARTEAAAAGAAPVDSEEKDVKIPVEAVDDTEANEAPAAEAAENQVEDSNKEATSFLESTRAFSSVSSRFGSTVISCLRTSS